MDGENYFIRPLAWDLDKIAEYWELYRHHGILSDEVMQTKAGFSEFVAGQHAIWFEIVQDGPGVESIRGLMYLTDMVQMMGQRRFSTAVWHATIWDGKAALRRPILKAGIRWCFEQFGLQRLQCEIPVYYAGTIRSAKKLGFVSEGTLRQARLVKGQWWDVAVLGLLRNEALNERSSQDSQ